FKPIFKLITNIIVFIKDLVVAFFFPNKKLQKLEIKSARQEYLEQKLLEKFALFRFFRHFFISKLLFKT
ncbi:MAG: hypothetical protein ACQBVK_04125, partial [Candidatus Phytoplasma sp. TWB_XP]